MSKKAENSFKYSYRFESATRIIGMAIAANVPVMIWGKPGTAKTSYLNYIAKKLDLPIEIVILSIREPTDIGGLPIIDEKNGSKFVSLSPPNWAVRLQNSGKGILCFDEYSTASMPVQAASLRVIFEKCVGDVKLPDEVRIVAISNPPESSAGGWPLSLPAISRFIHVDWEMDTDVWADGCRVGFEEFPDIAIPDNNWVKRLPEAIGIVTTFLTKISPDMALKLPSEEEKKDGPFPCYRSWKFAIDLLACCFHMKYGKDIMIDAVSAAVGPDASVKLITWYESLDLVPPEILIDDPSKMNIDRDDIIYANLSAVTAYVKSKRSDDIWLRSWKVIKRAVDIGKPDIAAAAALDLVKCKPKKVKVPPEVISLAPILAAIGEI